MAHKHYSPLRYPGGKGRLGNFMKDVFYQNDLSDGVYIEPYAGGAGVALELLLEECVREIVINDIDPSIYSFWHSVLHETDALLAKIQDTPLDMDEWRRQKQIYKDNDSEQYSLLEVGFSAFYLNRTCWSGILGAGVIGGNEQKGDYKIDARYNKKNLMERITLIARHSDRIHLYNLDALDLLDEISEKYVSQNSLIYCDPPYYAKGSDLYRNFHNDQDHLKVAEKVKSLSTPWIVTYDDVNPIRKLYSSCESIKFFLQYSVNNDRKRKATELMFYKGIDLPYHPNKLAVKRVA